MEEQEIRVNENGIIMSTTIGEITKALVEAQKKITPIGKAGEMDFESKKGGRTNYAYALYTDMWKAGHDPLTENGLDFSVHPMGDKIYGIMKHTSGEYLGGYLEMKVSPNQYKQYDGKDVGEWVTYLSKYMYRAALNLPTDDTELLSVSKNMEKAAEKQDDEKQLSEDDKMYRGLATASGLKVQGVDSTDDIDLKVSLVKAFLKENGIGSAKKVRDKGKPEVMKLLRGENNEL